MRILKIIGDGFGYTLAGIFMIIQLIFGFAWFFVIGFFAWIIIRIVFKF